MILYKYRIIKTGGKNYEKNTAQKMAKGLKKRAWT